MKQNKKNGFVVSAVLYPLLILFLALIMGLLSMSDTRKRILDKMKLEISDSVFDEATCSCDTILNKLNYLIKNGVGGGGGGGSYTNNVLGLNVTAYETAGDMPNVNNASGDIAVITTTEITNYYVSPTAPTAPKEGTTWIIMDRNENYYILSDYSNIPISYIVQYEGGKWVPKQSYVYDATTQRWKSLNYIDSSLYTTNFEYTGKYQKYTATYAGTYKIQLWGAEGGTNSGSYPGGTGGYTEGEIYLEAGEILYFYVGAGGGSNTSAKSWNGGGGTNTIGGVGGGATDVRLTATAAETTWNEFNSLKSRIMVAGGGGGGGWYGTYDSYTYGGLGGVGGTLAGGTAYSTSTSGTNPSHFGAGGNQTAGGAYGYGANGSSAGTGYVSGGGGGGYYGGYGGLWVGASGGGGSSFISGYEGCNAVDVELSETDSQIIHTGQSVHSSGKKFINGYMEAGVQGGNGKASITLTTVGETSPEKIDEVGTSRIYNFTGAYEALHITTSGTYEIEAWGAQGGTNNGSYPGGKGGYTKGQIYLEKGETIYIYVGGAGTMAAGGYNGGGSTTNSPGSGGGGATDIRVNINSGDWNTFDNLKNRIMVAAGGGGGISYGTYSNYSYYGVGGGGGGSVGIAAQFRGSGVIQIASGGTQTAGGIGSGGAGGFGYGGAGTSAGKGYIAGGGGSGWYGGGGGNWVGSSGAGGSSYISGHNGCNTVRESSTSGNIIHLGVSESPTGYVFTNTTMNSDVNSGNGKAKVTLLSTTRPIQEYEIKDVYTFDYDGAYIPFIIPRTGNYQVELWGAQGGTNNGSYPGGNGGYTSGKINLIKGTIIYIYIGGQPTANSNAGINGGGYGGPNTGGGGGGGGATDIRLIAGTGNDTASYASRIMVAAGGGGGIGYGTYNNQTYYGAGGIGGGLIGYNGNFSGSGTNYRGFGGTQIAGGSGSNSNPGTFGKGGNGSNAGGASYVSGGGGSGWYGGGGGYWVGASGGGGSSYISGHAGCIGVSNLGVANATEYTTLSDSYSYTGYKFSDTVMIDGMGYNWTTEKGEYVGMPQYDGVQVMTGNTGNGFAKITWLGTS